MKGIERMKKVQNQMLQPTKKTKMFVKLSKSTGLYLLLLPSVISLILFNYIPMYGVLMAFQDYNPTLGIWGSKWVGFDNFIHYFQSWQFGKTIYNTFIISILNIVITFPLPILLALMCNQMRAKMYKKFFQVSTYLPHFISTVVMCGMIILFTSPSRGIIAQLLKVVGITFPNVMGDATAFPWIYALTELWQHLGWDSILYIAALSSIDPTYYEAAKLDGATKFQIIRYVDIPSILPVVCIQLILRSGGILSVGFEKTLLLQNNMNLAGSEVISTYVYKLGILGGQYGLSAAIGLFNTLVCMTMLLAVNKIVEKLQGTSLF